MLYWKLSGEINWLWIWYFKVSCALTCGFIIVWTSLRRGAWLKKKNLITQGNISWSRALLSLLDPTRDQTLGHFRHKAEPWGIHCFTVLFGTGDYRIAFYSWGVSVWQDPEERLGTGVFLTKISVPEMLLRCEILTDLPENCKEATKRSVLTFYSTFCATSSRVTSDRT